MIRAASDLDVGAARPPGWRVPRSNVAPKLNVGRQARLDLALWAAIDARDGDDPDEYQRRLEDLVALNHRLRTEQLAELGYLPWTVDGCIAVLHVAARVIDWIAGRDA